MIVVLLRLLLLISIGVLVYIGFKYVINPKRKLELAQEQQRFYVYDDKGNVHKNFLLTYKGAMFEGEKYLGTTEQSFEVVTVNVSIKDPTKLKGFSKEDFYFIEHEILIMYPHANIIWKDPMKQLMKNRG